MSLQNVRCKNKDSVMTTVYIAFQAAYFLYEIITNFWGKKWHLYFMKLIHLI